MGNSMKEILLKKRITIRELHNQTGISVTRLSDLRRNESTPTDVEIYRIKHAIGSEVNLETENKKKCKCHGFYKGQNTFKFCPECGRSLIKKPSGIYGFCKYEGCSCFNHFYSMECDYRNKGAGLCKKTAKQLYQWAIKKGQMICIK